MAENFPSVLIIEDEAPIRRFLRLSLESRDFNPFEASTGAEGLSMAAAHTPEIILLDLGLPDMDGLEIIRRLREWTAVPIIILSARGQEQDKITALESGADDYLTKPFSVGELAARIKVVLRRQNRSGSSPTESVFQTGQLKVDLDKRLVFVGEKEIHLTPIEYKLLSILVRHAGRLVTQKELLRDVWGPSGGDSSHYLRIYVSQLRRKLEETPAKPRYLITEAGVGYRLKTD
ncbi:MAG TPA: response regulator [bacterium]|nr:response regulator [bacterium]